VIFTEGEHHMSAHSRALAVAGALVIAAAACSDSREPRACQRDADCPTDAFCAMGACVAGALPEAVIRVRGAPAAFVSHRAFTFDGADSSDPNPDRAVTSYAWSVHRGAGARCDASPSKGSEQALTTMFTCEGEYRVELTVTNSLGLTSPVTTTALTVQASLDPPVIVSTGPDLVLDHTCSGSPLTCTPVDAYGATSFVLDVTATDTESGAALAYAWDFEPPPGVDKSVVTVRFEPHATTRTPIVHVETAGTRISGDWTFTVAVRDGDGLTSLGQQKVTIGNQPPEIVPAATLLALDHHYQQPLYAVDGQLVAAVQDPDGDPIDDDLALTESAPTQCAFEALAAKRTGGTLSRPFSLRCGDPAELIGAVTRELALTVKDVNGGSTTAPVPLLVMNRPPVLAIDPLKADLTTRLVPVPHGVTACGLSGGSCYFAEGAIPLVATDPDGDPLGPIELATAGLDARYATFSAGQGRFRLDASTLAPAAFRSADGRSPVTVTGVVRDPWSTSDAGMAGATFGVAIQNRPPRLAASVSAPTVNHGVDLQTKTAVADAAFAQFVDDDGDPIVGVAGNGDATCGSFALLAGGWVAAHCTRPDVATLIGAHTVGAAARDAWSQGPATAATITVANRAPTLSDSRIDFDDCVCQRQTSGDRAYVWVAPGYAVPHTVYPNLSDPDGDLLGVSYAGAVTTSSSCYSGACSVGLSFRNYATLTVTASDGVASTGTGTITLTSTCSRVGQACTP
jgi:hypothetical protein